MNLAMSSSRNVSVSLVCVPIVSDQVARRRAGRDEALDDEPIGCLEEQDVPHPALVEERPDRAEDLLEVLAGAALVDPHAVGPSPGQDPPVGSGPSVASALTSGKTAAMAGTLADHPDASLDASSPATCASLTIRAVFARTDAPSVRTAIRARSHGVRAGPATSAAAASAMACSIA